MVVPLPPMMATSERCTRNAAPPRRRFGPARQLAGASAHRAGLRPSALSDGQLEPAERVVVAMLAATPDAGTVSVAAVVAGAKEVASSGAVGHRQRSRG
eukprot:2692247-Prymnesium_polylepis.1